MEALLAVPLFSMLVGAVCTDIRSHRIPNLFLLLGVAASAAGQMGLNGLDGMITWAGGLVVGFLCFWPLYIFAGMAAGDVKLIAVVGSYLGATDAFWAAMLSLIAGGVLGVLILLYKKQLFRFVRRYWVMASLGTYIQPGADDAARQRFPYALAILLGTVASLYWQPISL
ncbi:A24 family peptidase [Pseudomonas paeninsulae]|uniref:A24 family peptidase n=1 Tax=Pseudomonas paeninsulae TaxID=3110772 RepID=UPI002D78AA5B|nr:prepilin peptidase [Pseudomonas sp. IT1137]